MTGSLLRVMRFVAAGSLATGTSVVVLYALITFAHVWYLGASVVSFLAGFCVSFTLQKFWTFRDRAVERIGGQALLYLAIMLANLSLNTALMYVFVEHFDVPPVGSQIAASAIIAFESFFAYRFFVFWRAGMPDA